MPTEHILEDHDESVRIAVRALDDMRNAALHRRSTPAMDTQHVDDIPPNNFVSRVSHLPLVNSAMSLYEQGKASSRVVKYGAEMMESSVKSISRPVIDRIPPQWDEFACRQLNRIEERYCRPPGNAEAPSTPTPTPRNSLENASSTTTTITLDLDLDQDRGRTRLKSKTLDGSAEGGRDRDSSMMPQDSYPSSPESSGRQSMREDRIPAWREATSPFGHPSPALPSDIEHPHDQSTRQHQNQNSTSTSVTSAPAETQVVQRSRWQAVLLEAGGLSAALSDESMRRLKYCLHWLQYATAHIDAQILILRDFIASLQPLPLTYSSSSATSNGSHPRRISSSSSSSSSSQGEPSISSTHMRTLTDVRKDIVNTVKQVVDVVSRYAGGTLPEPARRRVRVFILKLPQRWATRAGVPVPIGGGGGEEEGGGNTGGAGKERERDSVTAAASGITRRGGNRRAAHRERGLSGAGEGAGRRSAASSRATSPSAATSPRVSRAQQQQQQGQEEGGVTPGAAVVAAQRILVLATESLDMMRGVTGVVKESLGRADAWVGRLRTVGIQRGNGGQVQGDEEMELGHSAGVHSRRDSTSTNGYREDEWDRASSYSASASSATMYSSSYGPPGAYSGGGSAGMPSPGLGTLGLGMGGMSLGSIHSTPRSGVVELPFDEVEYGEDEDKERERERRKRGRGRYGGSEGSGSTNTMIEEEEECEEEGKVGMDVDG